jgi:hypothetical protein
MVTTHINLLVVAPNLGHVAMRHHEQIRFYLRLNYKPCRPKDMLSGNAHFFPQSFQAPSIDLILEV